MNNILKAIESAKKIVILSHINVDGDGVGSALALFHLCKKFNKQVCVAIDSALPTHITFLEDTALVNKNVDFDCDLVIYTDCNNPDRVGRLKFKVGKHKNKINIDHHFDNTEFGRLNLVKKGYSSACEVIYDLCADNDIQIDEAMARCMLVGILTDTGNLSYDSATSDTFRKVATLLDITGLSIDKFTRPLFASDSIEVFNLKKLAYEKIEFSTDFSKAVIAVSFDDMKRVGVDLSETKSIIGVGFGLEPVQVLVAITEAEPGVCFVSFRTKGSIDACKMASAFGGGGHKNASGCRIYDSLANVVASVRKVIKFG